MNPRTLAALIVVYATAGALLAVATRGAVQGWTAFFTGTLVALAFGASWPVHRVFPIAGMALGALTASVFAIYLSANAYASDSFIEYPILQYVVWGLATASAFFGAWTTVLLIGAGAAWVVRRLVVRPAFA